MNRKVVLACTKCFSRNYSTTKNIRTNSNRLEVKKFCRKCGNHQLHRETK